MQVKLTTPANLSHDEFVAWATFQEQAMEFDSPYFRPEFAKAVAAVRDDVEVAVLQDGSEYAGFFPFQRTGSSAGKPLAGRLSDYQAIVGKPDLELDASEFIRQCRLNVLDFDHMLVSQRSFQPFHRFVDHSPYLNLSRGFEAYRSELRSTARTEMRQTFRLGRKLSREVGEARCEVFSQDTDAFDLMLRWKIQQYETTNVTNVFSFPWTIELLREIWKHQSPEFSGVLSVLYAGDRVVATHFGMRSGNVLHWWFPAYDQAVSKYGPGRVLLAMVAEQCQDIGITKIDLGRGVAPYKSLVMSDTTEVAVGSVDLRPVARCLRTSWRQTRQWVRNSPLYGPARIPGRIIHRISEWLQFQ